MQQVAVADTVEIPLVKPMVEVGDRPGDGNVPMAAAAPAGDAQAQAPVPDGPPQSILIYVQAFTPDGQQRVLSMWNTGDPDGLLGFTIAELRRGGWFNSGGVPEGSDPTVCRRLALASALLVAVAGFEAAAVSDGVPLEEVDQLLGGLLARREIPVAGDFIPPVDGH